jgi:ketosteroid isomerase-like protein
LRSRERFAVCALAVTAATTWAGLAQAEVHGTRATAVVSRNANGPSTDGSFSQDGRRVSYFAFSSVANNLVRRDTNGRSDVFALHRSGLGGSLSRISVANNGAEANGDSTSPSVDGDAAHAPHCVAFQSNATNLDRRDPSPDWDIYLRDLRSNRTRLVSTDAPTDAVHPVVDGACKVVTYESGGTVYARNLGADHSSAIASGSQADQQTNGKGVAYVRDGQVWYRAFQRAGRAGVAPRGHEVIVSQAGGGPGNGSSSHPSISDNGSYIAFESTATNLCAGACVGVSGDGNGAVSDVFRRTMSSNAPTHDLMEMVSYSHGSGTQGNGPSNNPVISGAGQFVVFDSAATDLRPTRDGVDPNGPTRDIFLWNFSPSRGFANVSRESRPGVQGAFSTPSTLPSMSSHGNYIGFVSAASGQISGARRGEPNVLMRFLGGASVRSAPPALTPPHLNVDPPIRRMRITAQGSGSRPRDRRSSMSSENEAVVRRFFEEFCNERRLELADEIIHPDWELHEPHDPPASGREGAVATVRLYQEGVDGHWEIQEMLSVGDKVVTRWVGTGVHNSELMGIPPTGREIRVDAITIHRLKDGMIIEHRGVWDALSMLQQLGVVEAPAAAAT